MNEITEITRPSWDDTHKTNTNAQEEKETNDQRPNNNRSKNPTKNFSLFEFIIVLPV